VTSALEKPWISHHSHFESIVLKGKDLPCILPLVEANFLSEVETLVLTAGHDADLLVEPIRIDVSRESDVITQMNGEARQMYAGDMVMRDAGAVSCSVIYGQDNRSPISARTERARTWPTRRRASRSTRWRGTSLPSRRVSACAAREL
jgi:hypothetical protein